MTTAKHRNHLSDLRGASRLAIDATRGIADLVEAMHHNIVRTPALLDQPPAGRTRGITGLVYRSVRGVTRLVGGGIDAVLGSLAPLLGHVEPSPAREAIVAALNGVLGDYLAETGNPLAIAMRFRRDGKALRAGARGAGRGHPACTGKLLVLAHGLCLNDLQWNRRGHDHGAALARDLGCTPVYLHYNTGLHISTNGRQFAEALEALVAQWPVPLEELAIVAHSMGGLVARSACHYGAAAGHAWPRRLRALVFLGTPHHGAPLERGGNWIDTLLEISPTPRRSRGWARSAAPASPTCATATCRRGLARARPLRARRSPALVPLPDGVRCFAIAATRRQATPRSARACPATGSSRSRARSAGTTIRPSTSRSRKSRQWIAHDCGHLDLLDRPEVYRRIRRWLDAG